MLFSLLVITKYDCLPVYLAMFGKSTALSLHTRKQCPVLHTTDTDTAFFLSKLVNFPCVFGAPPKTEPSESLTLYQTSSMEYCRVDI